MLAESLRYLTTLQLGLPRLSVIAASTTSFAWYEIIVSLCPKNTNRKESRLYLMYFPTARSVYSESSSDGNLSTLLQEKKLNAARIEIQIPGLRIFIRCS